MKTGNLTKWTNISECNNLLFFSQLVNELLFDYSIPSNRISTLNSHYLCLDALSAIEGIENRGVPEGTLKPIMEELYSSLTKDPVFDDCENPKEYFLKFQNDRYVTCSRISDIGYEDLKQIALTIEQLFFNENVYYEKLKEKTISLIEGNRKEDQEKLFRITKSLLTELMNAGYSLRYMYMVMNNLFWNSSSPIVSCSYIRLFFENFIFDQREYLVIFKVKEKGIGKLLPYLKNVESTTKLDPSHIKKLTKGDDFLVLKEDECYIVNKIKGFDPFEAYEKAKWNIETISSFYRLYAHRFKSKVNSKNCRIFDDERYYKIVKDVRPVEHTQWVSEEQISESIDVVTEAIGKLMNGDDWLDASSVLRAIQYHSHSLDSISEENQLLDLWAIFESVLDISNKHTSDRIQQVCMYLVPLLKQKYIYSLFEQFADDIKCYDENVYSSIVCNEVDEFAKVRLVCEFTLLESNKNKRESFLTSCTNFPLLRERMEYYCNVLKTPSEVYSFVEKHAERVRWQIMRIYRNRNLIIHNGNRMPYLPLLIENLHSYVDDFIAYLIQGMSEGKNVKSMCQELFVRECKWNLKFQKGKGYITSEDIEYMLSL